MSLKNVIVLLVTCIISACAAPKHYTASTPKQTLETEKLTMEDKIKFRLQEISTRIQNAGTGICSKIPAFNNGCVYEFDISSDANAYTIPGKIHVNSDIMSFAKTEDELAIILGYEYAHNILNDNAKNSTPKKTDYLGLYITATAGFNITNASELLQRLALRDDLSTYIGAPHPSNADRYLAIEKTTAEIRRKQHNGAILMPSLKD